MRTWAEWYVEIVQGGPKREKILYIALRGKRGVGFTKVMPGVVFAFTRMVADIYMRSTPRRSTSCARKPDAVRITVFPVL